MATSLPQCRLIAVSSFRFPDGVRFLGEFGSEGRMTVSMPIDEEGYVGRECPSCRRHFRVQSQDYEALPDDQRLWCVYCGHDDEASIFITTQQITRARRAATDYAEQLVRRSLGKALQGISSRSRNSLVRIEHRSTPFRPRPLPGIDEERLIRERTCPGCDLRYAVFGEHRFCPTCGSLPALATALDSLAADVLRLDALSDVPTSTRAQLRESGALDRTYVDTIENAVAVVETLAKRVFEDRVPDAEVVLRRRGQVFQRLDDLADLFERHLSIDVRSGVETEWAALKASWAIRHVFTHCDGIVDAKYFADVPTSPLRQGQRLLVSEDMARQVLRNAERLCRSIGSEAAQ